MNSQERAAMQMALEVGAEPVSDFENNKHWILDEKQLKRFANLVAEAEGKRFLWACEQARNNDESLKWLDGFDACVAVLNAERIETK